MIPTTTNLAGTTRRLAPVALLMAATFAACERNQPSAAAPPPSPASPVSSQTPTSGDPNYPSQQPLTPGYASPVAAYPQAAPPPAPQYEYTTQVVLLNSSQIDDLTAPIALYPDPLLAEVLPASTYPSEILSAYEWQRHNPLAGENTINQLPFQPPVRALIHYPTVLQMMAEHIDWTQALGTAFTYQQPDVIASVQRLRLQAQLSGALISTPQQTIIYEYGCVRIVPAYADVIYVPYYDPRIVYVVHDRPPPRDCITFSRAGSTGLWLSFEFDWNQRTVTAPHHESRQAAREPERTVQGARPAPTPQPTQQQRAQQQPAQQQPAQQQPAAREQPVQRDVWVRDRAQPAPTYPQRAVTPTPEKKVVTPPPPKQDPPADRGRGQGQEQDRGRGTPPDEGRGRGRDRG